MNLKISKHQSRIAPFVVVWAKVDLMGDNQGGHLCQKQIIKKPQSGICQAECWLATKPLGECPMGKWDQKKVSFCTATSTLCSQMDKWRMSSKKKTLSLLSLHKGDYSVQRLLCCIWQRGSSIFAAYKEIPRLFRDSTEKWADLCQKAWSQSEIMGFNRTMTQHTLLETP